ncbi:MAG TPA: UDP-3-O-(3-hydroxymyristoyl)glucosamine N-acyltransferase [Gemmatimonadaceae bacterium]|nr:UDP-3-O-(3-hydroxymyristoyl)glucosamine N-acyltransferase [Gemmatimonadaceae bacterium]
MTDNSAVPKSLSGERACTLTAEAIAALTGGELRGDGGTTVDGVAALDRATGDKLSFLGDGRYVDALGKSSAGIVLITPELADSPGAIPARVIVAKPMESLLGLLPKLYPPRDQAPGIAQTARIGARAKLGSRVSIGEYSIIGEDAVIGDDVVIGPHVVVGAGAKVGSSSRLFPHVTLYAGTELGSRVVLHSGVRAGSDGFGYVFAHGAHAKIPHVGRCIIGDDVEIGANTTVDRGSIDDTVVGAGTKIDNLVQIGHNVRIGRLCMIMSQVGIAGSARIEDGCVIAGQAGLGGHITIGKGAKIAGQSGVFGDVPAGESWSGYPARPHRESLRATGATFKIAGMMKRLEKLLEEKESE